MIVTFREPTVFHWDGEIVDVKPARYSTAILTGKGIVNLTHAEVVRILPQLQEFARTGKGLDD